MKLAIAAFYPAATSNYTKGRTRPIAKFTVHHSAGNENTLRYLWADPARNGSSHFWVGNTAGKIEQYVDTNDTAWTNGNWNSNCESITCEVRGDWRNGYYDQTTLNNLETLMYELLKVYPQLQLEYHMDVSDKFTECPADLKHKAYALTCWNKAKARLDAPKPIAVSPISYEKITPKRVELIRPANLWNFNFTDWSKAVAVKEYPQGNQIDTVAVATNSLGAKYYMTPYSYNDGAVRATNGFNVKDCKDVVLAPVVVEYTPVNDPIAVEPSPINTDPITPTNNDMEARITALEKLVQLILDFMDKFFNAWRSK